MKLPSGKSFFLPPKTKITPLLLVLAALFPFPARSKVHSKGRNAPRLTSFNASARYMAKKKRKKFCQNYKIFVFLHRYEDLYSCSDT